MARGRNSIPIRALERKCRHRKLFVFVLIIGSIATISLFLIQIGNLSRKKRFKESFEEHRSRSQSNVQSLLDVQRAKPKWSNLVEASTVLQNHLHYIMHPKNCTAAKKLYCKWNGRRCGFGCTIHRLAICISAAYKLQRTVYLDLSLSFDNAGFESWFKPISNCNKSDFNLKEAVDLHSKEAWEGIASVKKNVNIFSLYTLSDSHRWPLPQYVFNHGVAPPDIVERLKDLHHNPGIWYLGQLIYYMIGRLAPSFKATLEETKRKIGYTHPIAAIHIRRGDKIGVDAYAVEEKIYMEHIKLFFNKTFPNLREKKVFLATDDTEIKRELHKMYPEYVFITHQASNSTGEYFQKGYDQSGLSDILHDFFLLAESDYTVCTFSSNICRLQYELKQAIFNNFDASEQTISVDRPFILFRPFDWRIVLAIEDHQAKSRGEISFKKGDFIEDSFIKSNWNLYGRTLHYSNGLHYASGKQGKYPLWKVVDYPGEMDYPSYDFLETP